MKKIILALLLLSSVFVQAQSLKDALYGGKLKNQAGSVIRKGDDLSAKMDTATTAAPADSLKGKDSVAAAGVSVKPQAQPADSSLKAPARTATAAVAADRPGDSSVLAAPLVAAPAADTVQAETAPAAPPVTAAPKDNNALWKDHINALIPTLKSEVLPSRKLKKGSYYVLVTYVIETDGQVTVDNVVTTPENEYLQQQVKDRLSVDVPRMSPVLNSVGAPRKVTRRSNFTLVKE